MRRFLIISLLCGLGLIEASQANADQIQVQENAPNRYVVVKGDTLWDISGRFLKQPWRWPEIWRLNKEEIKNPHWIYPGDVIVLDRSQTPPRLSIEGRNAGPTTAPDGSTGAPVREDNGRVRLSPTVKLLDHADAIPSIGYRDIQAFMGHPLVVEARELSEAPKVVAFDGRRTLGTDGEQMFASGPFPAGVRTFQVYHPGPALIDPVTKEVLAYRADYVGSATVTEEGDPARFVLSSGAAEVNIGDRLLVTNDVAQLNYVPSAPTTDISAQIISIADGSEMAARNNVVIISRGARDGLQPGNVLAVYPSREEVGHSEVVPANLPQTRSALLFVFRTFDRVAYALIVQSQRPVNVPDFVRNP